AHTATLELTPADARAVAGARASGEISLALIPAADIAALSPHLAETSSDDEPAPAIRVMKFGRLPDGFLGNRGGAR
ncbi:MAG: hypothetical protein WBP94_00875, partial [Rhodomicrobiaceae bacterium]